MKYKNLKTVACILAAVTVLSVPAASFADEPTSFTVGKVIAPSQDKLVKIGGINYEIIKPAPATAPGKCAVSVNTLITTPDVVIPDQITIQGRLYDVTAIGENAFAENKYVKTITIGGNVETVAPTAFVGALSLKNISVDVKNKKFVSVDGILYTKDKTTVVACPMDKEITTYTAPNTVTSIAACAFYGNGTIYNVILNNMKVTEIGDFAFTNCENLSVVNMGYSIEKIGTAAFAQTQLKSIVLPAYLKQLGSGVFAGTKISSVKIPPEITEIPYGAFSNCTNLTDVKWGEKLEVIGDYAFANTAVKSVTVTDLVRTVGYSAFAECKNLSSVKLGKRVASIGDNVFANTGIMNIIIPASTTKIGENAFSGCKNLSDVFVESTNTAYSSEDGVLYSKGKIELLLYPSAKMGMQFTIPTETVNIRPDAFEDARFINEFKIGDGNKAYSVNDGVLYSIDGYELVRFPIGKNYMGYTIPENVYKVKSGAFKGCFIAGIFNIGSHVNEIGEDAFTDCSSITGFNVAPANQNYMSENGVLYTKDKQNLINYPIMKKETVFTVPNEVSVIKKSAFANSSITEVVLPEGLIEVGEKAFEHAKLSSINIPSTLKIIEDRAFANTFLTSVTIPGSLTEIGKYAFADNTVLSTVVFTGGADIGTVGANVFANDNSLIKIYVPKGYMSEYRMLLINMDVDNYKDIMVSQ